MAKERSLLSRIQNPFEKNRTVMQRFDLGENVGIIIGNQVKPARIVKISLNPSADPEIPKNLSKSIVPVYLLQYEDDSGNNCEFWHPEHYLTEENDTNANRSAGNVVYTS